MSEVVGSLAWKMHAAATIVIWFFFNISMGSLTKWTYLYGEVCYTAAPDKCHMYKFPFMITAIHMLFSWWVCVVVVRRRHGKGPCLSLQAQLKKIAPLALTFSVCVAMGNLSLKYIYPSFNQMLASVSPLVTVFVSVCIRGKRYNYWTWLSMPIICGGLLVCSQQEVNYNALGVVFVVGATVLRAIKTVMQEKLLDPKEKDLDSVTLLYYLAPWAGASLLVMSLCFEGLAPFTMLLPSDSGGDKKGVGTLLLLLTLSGLNACFLNISGNMVTAYMGAVMLQILGNVKACLSIIVSVAIFRNPVTSSQAFGVLTCLVGVWIYQQKGGTVAPPTATEDKHK